MVDDDEDDDIETLVNFVGRVLGLGLSFGLNLEMGFRRAISAAIVGGCGGGGERKIGTLGG